MKLLVLLLVCQIGYICGSGIFYEYHQPLIPFYDHYNFYHYQPTRATYPKRAEVQLLSSDGNHVVGRLMLTDTGAGTSIVGDIWGLTPGYHGFHVHENGELGDMCKDAGGHFNPDEKEHGAPTDKERHAGDLGNIDAGHDGVARIRIFDPMIRLNGGKYDISNKAIVVHADPDDLGRGGQDDSKTTGHAGARVACGIIRTVL